MKKKGFTLIELVVVIGILSVLSMILIPTVSGYITRSKETVIDTNFNTCYREYKAIETLIISGVEKDYEGYPYKDKNGLANAMNLTADKNGVYDGCYLYLVGNDWLLFYHLEDYYEEPHRTMIYDFN